MRERRRKKTNYGNRRISQMKTIVIVTYFEVMAVFQKFFKGEEVRPFFISSLRHLSKLRKD